MKTTASIITIVVVIILVALIFRIVNHGVSPNPSPSASVSINASSTEATSQQPFALASAAFVNGDSIPSQYTCQGANTQPPLSWSNAPEGTQSFAITMYDPDVPKQVKKEGYFDHWEIFNIPATTTSLIASSTVGILGNNGSGKAAYTGPCPPTQYQPTEHRYIFTLYALDSMLSLKKGATRADIEKAAATHTIATTTLMGRFSQAK
jgi:Raf kinase inhibitor-like YbhB/YbcL family protein